MHHDAEPAVSLAVSGPVATLTINRPDSYNALNPEVARGLYVHALAVEARQDLRVLVIRGAGRGFCAGGDIGAMAKQGDDVPRLIGAMLDEVHPFLLTLARMNQVVITAVHGVAAGAGLSLASMGDLCVATEDAVFVPSYLSLGVSPDCGGTVGAVRAGGVRGALELYLLKDRVTAAEAHRFGLVSVVVPATELDDELMRLAERICRFPPLAVANTKRLVRQAPTTPLAEQLDAEGLGLIACTRTEQFQQNVAAFLKKQGQAPK